MTRYHGAHCREEDPVLSDPFNGLRFDIYERVHLPDDVAAIEELEEIELVPRIQAQTSEDQVLLRGHLLLSGVYRTQERGADAARLEHWIPVEISLPPNRVERVEELSVEIDNFDVDLLSTRSLNVTGVLALRGFQAEPQEIPIWRDDSFTVVHQASRADEIERDSDPVSAESPPPQPESGFSLELEERESWDPAGQDEAGPVSEFRDYEEPLPYEPAQNPEFHRQEEAFPSPEDLYAEPPSFPGREWQSDVGWGDLSERRPDPAPIAEGAAAVPEERQELKVALGGKSLDAQVRTSAGVGLLSQLGEKGAAREAELQALRSAKAEADREEAQSSRSSTGDELEWTKLFLGKGSDAQPFQRVRMCIVQREDTLDTIAARYQVQAREIQMRNRLLDPYLSKGQVLYIP
jgi:stage VI sporulation protein D